ncbi:hypothetical protein, partial [Acidiphilium iwatense]|uniref:hypothetical protein n=1 Tax=Acidiphilium iwatense TaxID=768198 RepID=UPI001F23874E
MRIEPESRFPRRKHSTVKQFVNFSLASCFEMRLLPSVIDFAADLRFDDSATTEMVRDRETKCRKEVCGEAQPRR